MPACHSMASDLNNIAPHILQFPFQHFQVALIGSAVSPGHLAGRRVVTWSKGMEEVRVGEETAHVLRRPQGKENSPCWLQSLEQVFCLVSFILGSLNQKEGKFQGGRSRSPAVTCVYQFLFVLIAATS